MARTLPMPPWLRDPVRRNVPHHPPAWTPLADGAARERAWEVIAAIAAQTRARRLSAGAPPHAGLAGGDAGLGVFFHYLHAATGEEAEGGAVTELLRRTGGALSSPWPSLCLYRGASGEAWTLAHLRPRCDPELGEEELRRVEGAVLQRLRAVPSRDGYDLVRGIAGLGVLALERLPRPSAREMLELVVHRLDETAAHTHEGAAWFTPPAALLPWQHARFPRGLHDLGMAHGAAGVIALLSRVVAAGVATSRARELLTAAVRWLRARELPSASISRYPARVLPGTAPGPSRVAWCYGDLGVGLALLAAARSIGDAELETHARDVLRGCAARGVESAGVRDGALCHGAAGAAHLFRRAWQATGDEALREAARYWLATILEMRVPGRGVGGFAYLTERDGVRSWSARTGLLEGAAGVGLALLAAVSPVVPAWDRILLADVDAAAVRPPDTGEGWAHGNRQAPTTVAAGLPVAPAPLARSATQRRISHVPSGEAAHGHPHPTGPPDSPPARPMNPASSDLLAPAHLLGRATAIGDELLSRAETEPDGALTWRRGYAVDLGPAEDAGIFNGRIGEALFFAALFASTGDPLHEDAALRASQTLRAGAADPDYRERLIDRIGFGLTGVGSQVYALVRISQLLDRPELLDDAASLSEVFTGARIARDGVLDVFWGAAGGALGLLALYDHTGDAAALQRAVTCGDHLLSKRKADPETGLRAWATLEPVLSTGFAHGSSGIAHALLRLHQATDEARFYEAAIEAFAWERTVFREDLGDWPDTRNHPADRPLISAWCHGAPGMALSRLSALYVLREEDEADVVEDLDRALTRASEAPVGDSDVLCCGNFGRIDIILEAGRVLENDSLVRQARGMAEAALALADERGWALSRAPEEERHMGGGLWQGGTGIGYALLRILDPDRYPTVLAWT